MEQIRTEKRDFPEELDDLIEQIRNCSFKHPLVIPEELDALVDQIKSCSFNRRTGEERHEHLEYSDVIVQRLLEMLNDRSNKNARFSALMALARLGGGAVSAVPALRSVVAEETDGQVRFVAEDVLRILDGSNVFDLIEHWLGQVSVECGEYALNLLWELADDPYSREHITRLREEYVNHGDC